MNGFEFDINNMYAWIDSGVGGIFLAHFGALKSTKDRSRVTAYLSIVAPPPWPQCAHFLMPASSKIICHGTKLRSSQIGFLNMAMSSLYSTVTQ